MRAIEKEEEKIIEKTKKLKTRDNILGIVYTKR